MKRLNRAGNSILNLVDSMCPTGHEAGELGPNYAFLYYLIASTPEVAIGAVSTMMLGYSVRLTSAFVQSVPKLSIDEQRTLFVDTKGVARFNDNDVAKPSYKHSLNSEADNENTPGNRS